ncbi:helix-turn-helix domain-containing protein [Thauera sp. SDU_THAU2]|uniref:helix-turn-helix domain-containing protein n=1 Tax=Thauera sp. SDU_THAU2 TaxID=3136633 RepID=UPI00311D9BF6
MLNRLEMLRIFCTAAETRNFKEAATRLGVSPQAVTRAVKELEGHVGGTAVPPQHPPHPHHRIRRAAGGPRADRCQGRG